MIRRSQRIMSDENLKRRGSLDSPPILAKVPKLENDPVTEGKLDENSENHHVLMERYQKMKIKINDIFMEKIEKIMKKVDDQEATLDIKSKLGKVLDLNSKLDKVLNVLDEKPERPKQRTFMQFYGNVMEWSWQGHFDTENFMKNYGITGKKVLWIIGNFCPLCINLLDWYLQARLSACGRGDVSTPSFGSHPNPISTMGGRLCPPYTGVHTKF